MGRGGLRPNSGRPKGSKNRFPRPKIVRPEEVVRTNFLEAARELDDSGEIAKKMREWLNSPDERLGFATTQLLLSYSIGKPAEIPSTKADERMLEAMNEVWRRRGLTPPEPEPVGDIRRLLPSPTVEDDDDGEEDEG